MDDVSKPAEGVDDEIARLLREYPGRFNFEIGDLGGFDTATKALLLGDMKEALGITNEEG